MRSIPESLKPELAEWNGGKGIDLESWISCSGSYKLAVGYAECFWPEFVLVEDYIVRAGMTVENIREWEAASESGDRQRIEATMNHLHLDGINYSDNEHLSEDILLRLGSVLAEIYDAKLSWQFPDRPCTVSFFIPEDRDDYSGYELTFWQKAHELPTGAEQDVEANL